jgi:hypothetical protein
MNMRFKVGSAALSYPVHAIRANETCERARTMVANGRLEMRQEFLRGIAVVAALYCMLALATAASFFL